MVVQVLADTRKVVNYADAAGLEKPTRANTRKLQKLG
jgi:hypothetical protein